MSRFFWLAAIGFFVASAGYDSLKAGEAPPEMKVKLVSAKSNASSASARQEPKVTLFIFESGTRQDRWITKHTKAGSPLTKAARVVRVDSNSPLRKKHGVKKGEARLILVNRHGQVRGHYSGPLAARLALEDARRGY